MKDFAMMKDFATTDETFCMSKLFRNVPIVNLLEMSPFCMVVFSLGHISKQGNALLRFLLVEAAQVTVRSDSEWRGKFFHLAMRRGRKIAKVAMARRLAVRLYWMWRKGWNYEQLKKSSVRTRDNLDIAMVCS